MYKVINTFKDLQDGGHVYEVGKPYPKGDTMPTKKRIDELKKKHPVHKVAFIEEVAAEKGTTAEIQKGEKIVPAKNTKKKE